MLTIDEDLVEALLPCSPGAAIEVGASEEGMPNDGHWKVYNGDQCRLINGAAIYCSACL